MEQNRFLLTNKDSVELTAQGRSIMAHAPMNRFGTPDDLLGATMWLISPAEDCARLNLGYLDPFSINVDEWKDREDEGVRYVPKAGEILYRMK